MATEGELLKPLPLPPKVYQMPEDPVGVRPPDEPRADTVALLRQAFISVYSRFWRLVRITAYTGLVLAGVFLLTCCPANTLLREHGDWLGVVMEPVSWPLGIPLVAGYTYAFLLAVQGLHPKAKEIWRPMRSGTLYLNVLVAGLVPAAGSWLIRLATHMVFGVPSWGVPPPRPFAESILTHLPYVGASLLLTPFAFAALHAAVTRCSCLEAIRGSLRFASGNLQLLGGYALFVLASGLFSALVLEAEATAKASLGTSGDLLAQFTVLVSLLIAVVFPVIVNAVVLVHFYREFVWREREAAAPAQTA